MRNAEHPDTNVARAAARRAIHADPLFGPAWAWLGDRDMEDRRFEKAAGPLILAALDVRSPEAWAKTFAAAHRSGQEHLAKICCGAAVNDHGEQFHLAIFTVLGEAPDAEDISRAAGEIDRATRTPSDPERR